MSATEASDATDFSFEWLPINAQGNVTRAGSAAVDHWAPHVTFNDGGSPASGFLEAQLTGDKVEWFIDAPDFMETGGIIFLPEAVVAAAHAAPHPPGPVRGRHQLLIDDTLELHPCPTCDGGNSYDIHCPECDGMLDVVGPKAAGASIERRRELQRELYNSGVDGGVAGLILDMRTTAELEHEPKNPYLIDGLIPAGSIGFMYGFRSTGKTFAAVSIAAAIATGTDWYGHTVTQGAVVYQASEGQAGLGQRGAAWRTANGIDDIPDLLWLPKRIWLEHDLSTTLFVNAVVYRQPRLVIVDTLAQAMLGIDENTSAMGRAMEVAGRIRDKCGATTMFIHHAGSDGKRMRGHTSLDGAAEFIIRVTRTGRVVTLTNEKQKDAAEHEPMRFITRNVGDSLTLDLLTNEGVSNPTDNDPLLSAVCQLGVSSGVTSAALIKHTGIHQRTVYRRLKTLADQGLIRNVGTVQDKRWQATIEIDE